MENDGGMILIRKNLSQFYFVHHKSHIFGPGANMGLRGEKPAKNLLNYGTALQSRNIAYEAEWVPETVCTRCRRDKTALVSGIECWVLRP
jgi:hypothetical protein